MIHDCNRSKRHRSIWIVGTLAILLAACSNPFNNQATQPQRTAVLSKGTLVATVSAAGNIRAESQVSLSFQGSGRVDQVNVSVGDTVKQGDVLARLESTDQELALQQAQSSLIMATDRYTRTIAGADPADVSAAQAALSAAYASYAKLRAGPDPADVTAAEAAIRNAEAAYRQAQTVDSLAYKLDPRNYPSSQTTVQLRQARNNLDAARAQYDKVVNGPDQAQLAAAYQQVQDAKARLAKLEQPLRQYDVDQALADVQKAQLQVQQAQRMLDKARLIAPLDATVSAVNIKPGEMAGTGALPAVILVDLSKLHIDITVDEIDVSRVHVGQAVSVTLDALPDVVLEGKVDRVARTSTNVSGVVSYLVRVLVDRSNAPLRNGMTANAAIIMDRRQGVLLAPNWAIRRDKQTGKSYLTLKVDDRHTKEVEVKTGLRNDNFSEILSGASEGQTVVAPEAPVLLGQ